MEKLEGLFFSFTKQLPSIFLPEIFWRARVRHFGYVLTSVRGLVFKSKALLSKRQIHYCASEMLMLKNCVGPNKWTRFYFFVGRNIRNRTRWNQSAKPSTAGFQDVILTDGKGRLSVEGRWQSSAVRRLTTPVLVGIFRNRQERAVMPTGFPRFCPLLPGSSREPWCSWGCDQVGCCTWQLLVWVSSSFVFSVLCLGFPLSSLLQHLCAL